MSGPSSGPSNGTSGPPPPVPRRHPSRPSLKSTASTASSGPHEAKPPVTRRPTSSILLDSPGVNAIGYTGRVGLGSPRLEFFPVGAGRREGSGEQSDGSAVGLGTRDAEKGMMASRRGSSSSSAVFDQATGLPSPPVTNSEVGATRQISPEKQKPSPRPRLQPRISSASSVSSRHTIQRTNSNTSHTSSRKRVHPKASPSSALPRSSSSSSSIYAQSGSGFDMSPIASPTKSPTKHGRSPSLPSRGSYDRLSRHSSRRSSVAFADTLGGPVEELQHEVVDFDEIEGDESDLPLSRHTSRHSSNTSEQHNRRSPFRQSSVEMQRVKSAGGELDDRIREAEEKIKRVSTRSSRHSGASSIASEERYPAGPQSTMTGSTLRRSATLSSARSRPLSSQYTVREESPARKSVERTQGGEVIRGDEPQGTASSTLRRSATLSSARTQTFDNHQTPDRETAVGEGSSRERSNGSSGSGKRKPLPAAFRTVGPFTPSPKQHPAYVPLNGSAQDAQDLASSPEDATRHPASSYATVSHSVRRYGAIDSPSTRFLRHEGIEGLDRSPSSASPSMRLRDSPTYSRRQWPESISGLPGQSPTTSLGRDTDHSELPLPRPARAESVLEGTFSRNRYQSRSSTISSSSRFALTPGDSVSVVGAAGENKDGGRKDPLDVLRRIEQSREQHNRQWDEDRAASVIGHFDSSPRRAPHRPSSASRDEGPTVRALGPRSSTSMSSMRDAYHGDAHRSAPIHRLHRRAFEDAQLESPASSVRRTAAISRLSRPPLSEPRPARSNTSLGSARNGTALDVHAASTEHGRLLLGAFRALEFKLSDDLLASASDLLRSFQSIVVGQEAINSASREAAQLVNSVSVSVDLNSDVGTQSRDDIDRLVQLLRETNRNSDQSIRDLTRVMLDLPKLLREGSRLSATTPIGSVREPVSQIHRSGSIISRSSLDSTRSPEDQGVRRWLPSSASPVAASGRERRSMDSVRPSTSMANFVSRFRGSNPPSHSPRKADSSASPLPAIDQSPPNRHQSTFHSVDHGSSRRAQHYEDDRGINPDERDAERGDRYSPTLSSPRSPNKSRNILRKKTSSISTHTIRGSGFGGGLTSLTSSSAAPPPTMTPSKSAFFPSPVRRTTTAISQVTVGDNSPPSHPAKSIRSVKSMRSSMEVELDADSASPLGQARYAAEGEGEEVDAAGLLVAVANERRANAAGKAGRWKSRWGD